MIFAKNLTYLANKAAVFRHDNTLTHTAMIVQALLHELGTTVIEWPPYSRDLTPIKNIWALLKADN
jgi:transposase